MAVFSQMQHRYLVPLRERENCPERWVVRAGGKALCEAEICGDFIEDVIKSRLEGIRTEVFHHLGDQVDFISTLAEGATNPHAVYRIGVDKVVVKGYREVKSWNPEPLFLKHLSGRGPAPRIYAAYSYGETPLGIFVEFVEGYDPGASIYAAALSRAKGEEYSVPSSAEAVAKALGEFHSLMLDCKDPWCAPSSAGRESIESWIKRIRFYLGIIAAHGVSVASLEKLVDRSLKELKSFEGSTVLRTHQDFHFSQTLVTRENRVVIVDFEGEPARPEWASKDLEPAVRDLATLTRALSYIAFLSIAEVFEGDTSKALQALKRGEAAARRVSEWSAAVTELLAKAYVAGAPRRALPAYSTEEVLRLTLPWFVERALYETMYELEYRREMVEVAINTLEQGLPLRLLLAEHT